MSKTTPVRWWRDDADRYRSRGAYVAPLPTPTPTFEMLAPLDPGMTAELQRMYDAATLQALAAALALPAEVVRPTTWGTYLPIEDDLRQWQTDVERERRRLMR